MIVVGKITSWTNREIPTNFNVSGCIKHRITVDVCSTTYANLNRSSAFADTKKHDAPIKRNAGSYFDCVEISGDFDAPHPDVAAKLDT